MQYIKSYMNMFNELNEKCFFIDDLEQAWTAYKNHHVNYDSDICIVYVDILPVGIYDTFFKVIFKDLSDGKHYSAIYHKGRDGVVKSAGFKYRGKEIDSKLVVYCNEVQQIKLENTQTVWKNV